MNCDFVILIAAAGRPDLVARTLASLAECALPSRFREALIVENGPKCGIEAVVQQTPPEARARYQYVPEANKSLALNVALEPMQSEFVFFSDDDVRLSPDILMEYAHAAEGIRGGRFFGGPVGVDYEEPPPEWLKRYLPHSAKGWRLEGDSPQRIYRPQLLGINWGAFAADLKAIGGFDAGFGPGSATGARGQEQDAQARLLANGVEGWYLPNAMVWHYVPAERCSPAWVLERGARHGASFGLRFAERFPRALTLPYAYAQIGAAKACQLAAGAVASERLRFYGAYKESAWRGFVKGQLAPNGES